MILRVVAVGLVHSESVVDILHCIVVPERKSCRDSEIRGSVSFNQDQGSEANTYVGGALSGLTGSRCDWLRISSNCGQWLWWSELGDQMLTSEPLLISCRRTAPRKQQRAQPEQMTIQGEKIKCWFPLSPATNITTQTVIRV